MSTHSTPAAGTTTPTREAILTAAEQIIRERGVMATTTRLIARAADCSEGSIYNHFAGKDDLVAHVVCERLAAFPERARALPELAGSGEVADHLVELAALAIGFFSELMPLTGAMAADPASMRRRAAELDAAERGPRWTMRAVVEYLRREQQLGRVAPDAHLEGAAMALIGGAWHQANLATVWQVEALAPDQDAATELGRAIAFGLQVGGATTTPAARRSSERP